MISDICYEQIKDNFWLGQYGDFKVVMMKDCGWVNATKLCKDGGKEFKQWKRLEQSKRLIHALENELGHQASAFTPEEPAEAVLTCGDGLVGIPTTGSNTMHFVKTFNNTTMEQLISST